MRGQWHPYTPGLEHRGDVALARGPIWRPDPSGLFRAVGRASETFLVTVRRPVRHCFMVGPMLDVEWNGHVCRVHAGQVLALRSR